jgi:YidC/Oxa1 family membrane protein insertase
MEHARIFLAIGLSFLIFLMWDLFFSPGPPPQKPAETAPTQQAVQEPAVTAKPNGTEKTSGAPVPAPTPAEVAPAPAPTAQRAARTVTVDTPLFTARLNEQNADFESLVLKKYREEVDDPKSLKEMVSPATGGTVFLSSQNHSLTGLENALYAFDSGAERIDVSDQPRQLTFKWVSPEGVAVEKTYRFQPDSYLIGLTVTIKNGSTRTLEDNLVLNLVKEYDSKRRMYGFQGPSALINNDLEQIAVKKIEDYKPLQGEIRWIALETRYFISSIIPKSIVVSDFDIRQVNEKQVEAGYVFPALALAPGMQRSFDFDVFMGPKSMKLLRSYSNGLAKAIHFGTFDILAKPCLWLMNFIHDHLIPNYGVAIIMLTLLTKILLWPLGAKSYKSMHDMKKLQPLVKEIREKYSGDKKKQNEETMALYRTYKINPLGGCLPMLVQIPVFFALYRMLYEAIELRHAPFLLWINDLSAPDRLFHFNFSIPFMEPPYGVPVLTLIMGATMLLQQKMTPPMGDPTQAKMMMLMPVVFTFIFINFSSGLVLYWLTNNIFSIAQQYYTNKRLA